MGGLPIYKVMNKIKKNIPIPAPANQTATEAAQAANLAAAQAATAGLTGQPAIYASIPNAQWGTTNFTYAGDPTMPSVTKEFDEQTGEWVVRQKDGRVRAKPSAEAHSVYNENAWKTCPRVPGNAPTKDRVSAVSGRMDSDLIPGTDGWSYHEPFWILNSEYEVFQHYFFMDKLTGSRIHSSVAEAIFGGGWSTRDTLVAEGYIETYNQHGGTGWCDPKKVVPWVRDGKPSFAAQGNVAEFTVCQLTGRRYFRLECMTVHMDNSYKTLLAKVNKGMLPEATRECCHCSNNYLVSLLEVEPELGPKPMCRKCINKHLEGKVVRSHDDSNFLPAMPDYDIVWRKAGSSFAKIQKPNLRMYGVELEVGFNDGNRAETAMDAWNTMGKDFCYIKHDGSIINPKKHDGSPNRGAMKMGFEIVSAPAGINVHRERWKNLSKMKYFKRLRSWDTKVCGFHVHISKEALTPVQIGRLLVFANHPNNRYFIEVVAGRSSNCYTQYIQKELKDCFQPDENKYTAIRTNKKDTIEFRVFRGTINYKHIIRNIEFCDAVCDYCAPCETSIKDLADFRHFIAWVSQRRHSYPFLADWLATVDLVAKRELPKDAKAESDPEALNEEVAAQIKMMTTLAKSGKSIEQALKEAKEAGEDEIYKKLTTAKTKKKAVLVEEDIVGEIESDPDNF